MITVFDAVRHLYPSVIKMIEDVAYDIDDNKVVYDKDVVEAYVASKAYIAKRIAEYPAVTEQLDTIFHEGLDAWKVKIQAVKDKYPKGTT
jgi:hypothetical protein